MRASILVLRIGSSTALAFPAARMIDCSTAKLLFTVADAYPASSSSFRHRRTSSLLTFETIIALSHDGFTKSRTTVARPIRTRAGHET